MKQFTGDVHGGFRYTLILEDDMLLSSDEETAKKIIQGNMNLLFCDLIAREPVRSMYIHLNKQVSEAKEELQIRFGR